MQRVRADDFALCVTLRVLWYLRSARPAPLGQEADLASVDVVHPGGLLVGAAAARRV